VKQRKERAWHEMRGRWARRQGTRRRSSLGSDPKSPGLSRTLGPRLSPGALAASVRRGGDSNGRSYISRFLFE